MIISGIPFSEMFCEFLVRRARKRFGHVGDANFEKTKHFFGFTEGPHHYPNQKTSRFFSFLVFSGTGDSGTEFVCISQEPWAIPEPPRLKPPEFLESGTQIEFLDGRMRSRNRSRNTFPEFLESGTQIKPGICFLCVRKIIVFFFYFFFCTLTGDCSVLFKRKDVPNQPVSTSPNCVLQF